MFKKPQLFIFMILWAATSLASAQYKLIDSQIPIIDKMTQNYRGKSLSLSDLDSIVRNITQDGLFQVVYIEELRPGEVIVRAQKSARIAKIKFSGNSSFKEPDLISAMGIKIGKIISELEITQAIEKLREYYRDQGYYNFRISYSKSRVENGVKLNVTVDEQSNCIIEDLKIFSKNQLLKQLFSELIIKYKEKPFADKTSTEILKDINDLLLENRFLTAKVQNTSTVFNRNKTRVKINFTITNATQYEFVFHGNSYFSHFDLIKKSQIGGKFLYLSDSSSEIVDAVTDLYIKNGFSKVEVKELSHYYADQDKKVFVFQIHEGPRYRIGDIEVVGKISRPKSYYKSLFKEYLAEEAHTVYYVQKDIEHASQEMVTHLKRHGHLQAELLSVNADFTNEDRTDITIQIDEGILTYVRQVLFRGSKSFSNIELKDVVGIESNKPLNIEEVEASFEKLENFYRNRAHLEFKIMNRNASVIQYKPGQPYADIVYQVSEGPKIKVADIKVTGNSKTKEYVIIRELDFKPGDYLTLDKVTNSSEHLERTGLFGKVNIRSLDQDSPKSLRTIVVEVEERKPGLFSTGVGVFIEGELLTYRGYVGALYNNLWGKARAVSSRLDLRYRERIRYYEPRLTLSYYEPFLSTDRLRGRVSLVREERLAELDSNDQATIRSTNEIRLSSEKEYSRNFRLTYNWWRFSNLETFVINKKEDTDNTASQDNEEGRKTLNIGSIGPIFELDYRNDQFLPTSGSYSRLEIEYSDPIFGSSKDNPNETGLSTTGARNDKNNEIQFIKTTFSTSHYIPLTKNNRWVWANSLQGGYLSNVSSRNDSGVPQVESFFLGGASTIRGYTSVGFRESLPSKRELCINQGLIDETQSTDNDACQLDAIFIRKDSFFTLFKSELRFPISGAFGGHVFYDGGMVHISDFKLEDPYRDSVGMGFRYDTPVGSFILEFGYKLDRKTRSINPKFDDESEFAIHLAIGTF